MFSAIRRHLSYANVAATLALVFSMTGGALAAKHYIINSTKQLNPRVLKALSGKNGATGPKGAPGAAGLAGAAGFAGATGPQGTKGDTGATGPATGPAGGDLTGTYPNPTLRPPEGWHSVTFDETWCGAWENYTAPASYPPTETAGFYRDREGVVRLKGTVKNTRGGIVGSGGFGGIPSHEIHCDVFILPAGYRPAAQQRFATTAVSTTDSTMGVPAEVDVEANGAVWVRTGTVTGTSLDGVSFLAAPET